MMELEERPNNGVVGTEGMIVRLMMMMSHFLPRRQKIMAGGDESAPSGADVGVGSAPSRGGGE